MFAPLLSERFHLGIPGHWRAARHAHSAVFPTRQVVQQGALGDARRHRHCLLVLVHLRAGGPWLMSHQDWRCMVCLC